MSKQWSLLYLALMTLGGIGVGMDLYSHQTLRNAFVMFYILIGIFAGILDFQKSK